MAAYAALVSLENIIHDIQHHHSPPISFDNQQAQSLTQIVASLQEFLESHNTSSVSETDETDPLEKRIADAAYEAEDIIESHIVNRILPARSQRLRNGIIKFFTRFRAPKKPENIPFSDEDQTTLYEDLQRVIEEMEPIKKLTAETNAEKKAAVHHQRARSAEVDAAPSKTFSTRQKSITTVCSDDVINEVMNKLTSWEPDRHVIPIVGMGGIGKTTLAKDIYEKPLIKEYFQIRAWATISQQYNTKEILCEVLCQATHQKRKKLSEKSEDELGTQLHKYLFGEKYLIVMDDLWSTDAWDKVQHCFPENRNGSRVLVTTRLSHLGSHLNESHSHQMKFLDESSSWDLFSKTVFGEKISCPSELEGVGKKIVENCRGLPLSIVVVGGILKKMEHTRGCWESIAKNLTSVVNLGNDKHCLRLLSLSYSHLPVYLKPCFLYMGVFEEDSEIKVSTLIKLWVCEGFFKPINDESLEAIGKRFLKDLVDRNLILVHELGSIGNVKYCKIHDLLRDFCFSEGKKDGFYHVLGQDSPQGIKYGKVPSCQSLRLVRALHAYKFRYFGDESYVNFHTFQYLNLRHLAVEVNKTSSFFSSINLYWNLHSLIVACTHNSTAPVDIWKMPQFRRIEFVDMRLFLPDPPADAVIMENLETIKGVENFKFGDEAIKKIPNIKKLALRYFGGEGIEHEDYYFLSNIQRLHKLESLYVSLWIDFRKVESLNKLTFPHSLKKLTLSMTSNFKFNDILEKIGSLPLLEKLKLWSGGFRKGEWEISGGQFPCLKYLGIFSCYDLKKLTAQDQSSIIFPRLEQFYLFHLEELEEIPSEIGEITTLHRITMMGCTASLVKCAKAILDKQVELNGEKQVFHVVVSLVGMNEELQTLAGPKFEEEISSKILLTWGEPHRHVIPIVGMGGIGKTTLAKHIYVKPLIKEYFQIRAWATISQQYNTKEILCEVLRQAAHQEKGTLSEKSEDELGTQLHKYLFGEKYLIVMDDLWSIDAWDKLQRYFPDNRKGSRVLVTTRLSQLGSQLNESYCHHMQFLDDGSSWDLFSKIVFGKKISCPSELEGVGKKIVENCRGLPLSIVVVGGILKKMEHTRGCWESIGKNLTTVVNLENDKHCLRLLSLSYRHLLAYLKPCFLYMGVFEEDSEIKVSTLIKLWVSEGFLKPINDESLEAIGKGFLKDLVDRNLILVHELGSTGSIKYCKIHDLLRDFCLTESRKDEFYHVIGDDSPRGISRQRRLVIPRKTSKKKVLHDLRSMSHVRSVISEYGRVPSSRNFILVRAIHAYKFRYYDEESYLVSHAFQYVNLRHLAVEVNKTSSFFSLINLYWNLHTLIVSSPRNSLYWILHALIFSFDKNYTAPVDIWKMPQFRHIEFADVRLILPDPPNDAVVMENLEILGGVENFKFSEEVVVRIPNIKKLELRYSGHEGFEHENYYCLSNIERLCKLESLNVSLWIDFEKVESLYKLEKVLSLNKLAFPHSLKKLSLLMEFYFEWNDVLEKIGSLPHLEKLKLWTGRFGTGEWEIAEGQFPCLKYLGINSCSNLRRLTIQDQSYTIFPRLEQLHLFRLEGLKEISYEIGEIATLQKITMMGCTASMVKCAKAILDEQVELNGEEQVFHVVVSLVGKDKELLTLAGPNFEVYA